ncbi:ras-related protein Rab-26 isoform X6 [Delphinus delphis]|uniref:ras-related protein Rab-26 isoform X6 n=1 Tax=Delphinus delphis TaxID=9728 RepID=UPI0028C4FB1A|nr:ras-related protein Rab-26 isoform X6 [Delphinus delphis]
MSRKKTPKSKRGSAPATSALPATHGSQPVRPGTARPGPEAPPNRPPQPGRSSLGGGGDFYDVAFKVMLVGDSGVGKTCLLVRFKDGAFLAGTFISTVGIDFRIWDTAGQERFRSVTHAYYRDAHALLLLYDVTNKASFNSIQAWLTEIQEYAQHDVVLMLLGNKVDSAQERVVKREDGEKLAKEYGLPFMETSAKMGLNVDLAFMAIAKELKQRCMKAPSEPRFQLHDYIKREGRGASCCKP